MARPGEVTSLDNRRGPRGIYRGLNQMSYYQTIYNRLRQAGFTEAAYGAKETEGTSSETNTRMKQGAYKSFSHNGPSDGLR